MGRHERRAEIARFRRDAGGELTTYLLGTDDRAIHREPYLLEARDFWHAQMSLRKPRCVACEAAFADGAKPGAYLFSRAQQMPSVASVSVFCTECWSTLSDDDVRRGFGNY